MEETVKAVHLAMRDAGIDDPRDVHFVQIKCPLLTSERVEAALHRGRKTVTTSGYASMGYSRGASALGVATALGELKADVCEDQVLKDWNLFSSVASSSAGIELMHNVVIVMGNSAASVSPFVIGHSVMRDSIDLAAVAEALGSVGLSAGEAQRNSRLVNIFAKAEASPDGCVRGFRHTMLDDFRCWLHATRSRRSWRIGRGIVRDRRRLCIRWRRTSRASRWRPRRGDRPRMTGSQGFEWLVLAAIHTWSLVVRSVTWRNAAVQSLSGEKRTLG